MFFLDRDAVAKLRNCTVETIIRREDLFLDPNLPINFKKLSVKRICNPASVLDFTDHVLKCFPRVWDLI